MKTILLPALATCLLAASCARQAPVTQPYSDPPIAKAIAYIPDQDFAPVSQFEDVQMGTGYGVLPSRRSTQYPQDEAQIDWKSAPKPRPAIDPVEPTGSRGAFISTYSPTTSTKTRSAAPKRPAPPARKEMEQILSGDPDLDQVLLEANRVLEGVSKANPTP